MAAAGSQLSVLEAELEADFLPPTSAPVPQSAQVNCWEEVLMKVVSRSALAHKILHETGLIVGVLNALREVAAWTGGQQIGSTN